MKCELKKRIRFLTQLSNFESDLSAEKSKRDKKKEGTQNAKIHTGRC